MNTGAIGNGDPKQGTPSSLTSSSRGLVTHSSDPQSSRTSGTRMAVHSLATGGLSDSPAKRLRKTSSSTMDTGSDEEGSVNNTSGARSPSNEGGKRCWSKFTKNLFGTCLRPLQAQSRLESNHEVTE
jgi:hypothetical protein